MDGLLLEPLAAVDPATAKALGLYDQASTLVAERAEVEAGLGTVEPAPALPAIPELRRRIAAEFDRLEVVLAGGTLEERRALVRCYVQWTKADPTEEAVVVGLLPGLLTQNGSGDRI